MVIPGEPESTHELLFKLTDFINRAHDLGDCFDLACAVQTCANILGVQGRFASLSSFGYINPVKFISQLNWLGPDINNPFFGRLGINSPQALTGFDYLYEDRFNLNGEEQPDGLFDRTFFTAHTYVLLEGHVLDATVGAHLGRKNETDYLLEVRDTSTQPEARMASDVARRRFYSILKLE